MNPISVNLEPAADRQFVITRVYNAPASLLFEAYTKPEHIKRWFGPMGYPVTQCEMDFRVGGHYRFAMTGPDGVLNPPFGGEYLEIVPNEKISYDNSFELFGAEKMIITVTFEEVGGQTTLTIHTLFGSKRMKDEYLGVGYAQGTNSALDLLAQLMTEMQPPKSA